MHSPVVVLGMILTFCDGAHSMWYHQLAFTHKYVVRYNFYIKICHLEFFRLSACASCTELASKTSMTKNKAAYTDEKQKVNTRVEAKAYLAESTFTEDFSTSSTNQL